VQLLEQFHDAARHLRVQITGGLVRQQESRGAGQGARNRDTLLLAAGELGRIMPRACRQADALQGFLDAALALARTEAPIAQRHLDVIVNIQVRNQIERLKYEADFLVAQLRALIVVETAHIGAVEQVFAAGEFLQQARNGQKRRLAGARGARHGDEFAFTHVDGEIAQRVGLDDFGAVRLRQMGHFQHGAASSSGSVNSIRLRTLYFSGSRSRVPHR
jgi:hypothetical protein